MGNVSTVEHQVYEYRSESFKFNLQKEKLINFAENKKTILKAFFKLQ